MPNPHTFTGDPKTGYDFINAHLDSFMGKTIPAPIAFSEKIEIKYFVEK